MQPLVEALRPSIEEAFPIQTQEVCAHTLLLPCTVEARSPPVHFAQDVGQLYSAISLHACGSDPCTTLKAHSSTTTN